MGRKRRRRRRRISLARDGDPNRYVYVEAALCPVCDSANIRAYRTTCNTDGSRAQHTVCSECKARFIVIIELPERVRERRQPTPDSGTHRRQES
jgi:transcription elongation factor Elf1